MAPKPTACYSSRETTTCSIETDLRRKLRVNANVEIRLSELLPPGAEFQLAGSL